MPAKAMLSTSLGSSTVCSLVQELADFTGVEQTSASDLRRQQLSRGFPAGAGHQHLTMGARYGCFSGRHLRRQNRRRIFFRMCFSSIPGSSLGRDSRQQVDHAINPGTATGFSMECAMATRSPCEDSR